MHILWSLKNKFRCAVVKNQKATNNEIASQIRKLLTYGKQDQSGYTPVLLLTDNWYDIGDLKHSSRYSDNPNVCISAKLSPKEKDLFYKKYEELKDSHDNKDYIIDLVNNILKDLDVGSKQGRLLGFLALLNTYVHDSYMSLSLCEELMEIRNPLRRRETLEDKMNPYSTLLITFDVEEHGTYQAVRLLHQMIAENCLKVFKEHKLKLSDITVDLLYCENIYKTLMGKDFLTQFIQSMLVTRTRREQGDDKNTLFSPLIEDIQEEGVDKVTEVLERAVNRFDRSATLPQALARHMCLNEKDFDSALKWALDAQRKRSNSYMADTVGQVYRCNLKKIIEDSKEQSPESLDECLNLASKAVSAFKESQELAEKDEHHDPLDRHIKSRYTSYNVSGYLGETEVTMMLLDLITELPVFTATGRHSRDKMLQFLRGQHPLSSLCHHNDPQMNAIVDVLKGHERFLVSLKPGLKTNFTFFEDYFTYLRPRHVPVKRETVDEKNKRRMSQLFKKYINLFSCSEEEKLSEKVRNPKLSLQQEIVDHRRDLEMMQADSFAGLLQSLSHKDPKDTEDILVKWKFIVKNSGGRFPPTTDTVNYILANIVLHSVEPKSCLLKRYEELVTLLIDALQREGTHSNMSELYFLCMLLMWPSKDQPLKNFTEYSNITTYIASAKRSFSKRLVSCFHQEVLLLISSWENQVKLLRVKGHTVNGDIYVTYGTNTKIMIRSAFRGDIRSGCSREEVSFYIGFTLEGPVAYGVEYEN
uniref:Uncharacterized protein n=1 Tax=Neogobius melanostomus TaxID=47308 RepID=A0A8C6SRS9_9GOBI